jgi:hypothetical protein
MKKGKFMKVTLTIMFIFLLIFAVSIVVMGFICQYEPSTLIASVFAFCSVEGGLSAWIKTTKEKKTTKNKED